MEDEIIVYNFIQECPMDHSGQIWFKVMPVEIFNSLQTTTSNDDDGGQQVMEKGHVIF